MTDRDDESPAAQALAEAYARLDKATAEAKKYEAAKARAKTAVIDLLNLDAKRTEVVRRSPFSHTTVRAFAEAAGIPADDRYVRVQGRKPEAVAEPGPATSPTIDARILAIPLPDAELLVRTIRFHDELRHAAWVRELTAEGVSRDDLPYALIRFALVAEIITEDELPG